MLVRYPERVFRWCRTQKDISAPPVIEMAAAGFSGQYYPIEHAEVCLGGRHWSLAKGLIVLNTVAISDHHDEADVIAHEWRHHWQFLHGWKYDGKPPINHEWGGGETWRQNVKRYYTTSKSELDAMHFAIAKAGAESPITGPLLDYAPELYGRAR